MAPFKKSDYTIICEKDGKYYLWNTLRGGLAEVSPDVISCLSSGMFDPSSCPDFEELNANRYIVPSDSDEYGFILERAKSIKAKEDPKNMFFAIAPTLKCNYHCPYCFENDRTSFSSMSDQTSSAVKQFISEKAAANSNLKCLHITWFGGEPLLCLNTIEEISMYLLDFCAKRNIECRFSIITNGRYLDLHAIEILQKMKVKKVQISFDGPQKTYCQAKRASNEDYKQTLNNVILAAQCGLPLLIRINIRDNNFTPAYELADLLLWDNGLAHLIKLYPAFVVEGNKEDRAKRYADFVKLEKEYARHIINNYSLDSYYNKFAVSHGISCSLSCKNNYCIGPSGELYKCEHHFGQKDYVVGDVWGKTEVFADLFRVISENSDKKTECAKCPVFPICMGGCPNSHLLHEKNFDCKSFIEHLIDRQLRVIKGEKS